MSGLHKIIDSGLHARPAPSLATRVLAHTEDICKAFLSAVTASLDRIHEAELAAVARLETYVPTDRLLTRQEAAVYLHIRVRQLDEMTRPGSTDIPFNKLGKHKRFRKSSLDSWLLDSEIKKARVRL